MYFINAGELEVENSKPLERKGKSNDFEAAKQKNDKFLKSFAQPEVGDAKTKECIHFQTRN